MNTEQAPKPFNPVIVAPDGRPARLPANAKCPQCGADADQRVLSGIGRLLDSTCGHCAFEFDKETAS